MDKSKLTTNFEDFKKRIERMPKSEYSKKGHCLAQCDRKIKEINGERCIVCDGCKRIVHKL